jgi:hypothetical protein
VIYTDKNAAVTPFDVVVRTGRFPTQGKKVVLTKGTKKISFPLADLPDAIKALSAIALAANPNTDEDYSR